MVPRAAVAALLLFGVWRALDYLPYYGVAWSRSIAVFTFFVALVSLPLALVLSVFAVGLALAHSSIGVSLWFVVFAFLLLGAFEDRLSLAVLLGLSPLLAVLGMGFLPILLAGRLFGSLSVQRWIVCGLSVGALVVPGILLGKEVFAGFVPTGLDAGQEVDFEVQEAPESLVDLGWLREGAVDPDAPHVKKLSPLAEQATDALRSVGEVMVGSPLFLLLVVLWAAAGPATRRGALLVQELLQRTRFPEWSQSLLASLGGLGLGVVVLLAGFGALPFVLGSSLPELPELYATAFWSYLVAALIVLPVNFYRWAIAEGGWGGLGLSGAAWRRRLAQVISKMQNTDR